MHDQVDQTSLYLIFLSPINVRAYPEFIRFTLSWQRNPRSKMKLDIHRKSSNVETAAWLADDLLFKHCDYKDDSCHRIVVYKGLVVQHLFKIAYECLSAIFELSSNL